MKKLFTVAMGVMFVAALTSCKKDYSCVCTYNDGQSTQTYTYELKDVKKKDAKDACNSAGNAWILLGGSCDLK